MPSESLLPLSVTNANVGLAGPVVSTVKVREFAVLTLPAASVAKAVIVSVPSPKLVLALATVIDQLPEELAVAVVLKPDEPVIVIRAFASAVPEMIRLLFSVPLTTLSVLMAAMVGALIRVSTVTPLKLASFEPEVMVPVKVIAPVVGPGLLLLSRLKPVSVPLLRFPLQ